MSEIDQQSLLIVDDERDVLASLRAMFRRDYDVHTADGGAGALEILGKRDIHVILCDQRMPGMSGPEVLDIVCRDHPEAIFLMMSGYTDLESVIEAVNRGNIFRYICKPWDPADLEATVRQAFAQFELRAERRRLREQLEVANQHKTAFITVASHELNTPLTIVLGMLELALIKCEQDDVREFLDRARSAGTQMHELLADIFKVLQEQQFDRPLFREDVLVRDLFSEAKTQVCPYLNKRRQTLVERVTPDDLTINVSPLHFRDLLVNLITNAIKFSQDEATIELTGEETDDEFVLSVNDHGVGIDWADQPHVFEPLFGTWDVTHHSSGDYGFCKRGMGLGLTIANRFALMHGGEIDFDSTPGEGTVFRVMLPKATAQAKGSPAY
ncbi:Hydrogenase transcriptional regulatory protein hupR1 [Planctomycetes bacterium Pan216]|uniref:histidine kinase n=1 Tax=Kolteria novifilia TaxID=2527975 RepID=A0A518B5Q7_9BACT|nr:Hydrogenase transcriptional regulatory protein hupR1 [Planctomycetes bacterium Pan216]